MFAFVARQPILDRNKQVYAYELLFRDGKNNCYPDLANSQSKINGANHLTLTLDEISCSKTAFINFSLDTLFNHFPSTLDPSNVVVELGKEVIANGRALSACSSIKERGFKVALEDYRPSPKLIELLPHLDVVKLDVSRDEPEEIAQQLDRLKQHNVRLIADKVESPKDFQLFSEMGFEYFQGYFFSRPRVLRSHNLPASQLTVMQLVGESSSEGFDLDKINGIIERDPGLSYLLLRFINNPTINKKFKIDSLRHALTYMGEVEVKKFIALLALASLAENQPEELSHLSLVRAKFCDLVAREKGIGHNPPSGFLVGLFSLLDALLEQNMQQLVEQIPLNEDVKVALCGGQNELALYLMLVKAFESATWLKVKRISEMLELDQKRLHSLFNQAIVWGNGVRQSMSPHYPQRRLQ